MSWDFYHSEFSTRLIIWKSWPLNSSIGSWSQTSLGNDRSVVLRVKSKTIQVQMCLGQSVDELPWTPGSTTSFTGLKFWKFFTHLITALEVPKITVEKIKSGVVVWQSNLRNGCAERPSSVCLAFRSVMKFLRCFVHLLVSRLWGWSGSQKNRPFLPVCSEINYFCAPQIRFCIRCHFITSYLRFLVNACVGIHCVILLSSISP